jgi:class 3 adenylate cyclase
LPTSSDTAASNLTRELAAIMFSDVVGYTAIMGRDEQQALRALKDHRELLRLLLPKFSGRMVGEIGDGTLTSFHSAIDAVNCAREVQASLQQDQPDLKVRIGIHSGDVVFSDNTVLGDGVNVASRIHALAPPGGICVSASIYDEVRDRPGTRFKDLGEQKLKNVSRPIRVYQVVASDLMAQPEKPGGHGRRNALIAGAGAVILAGLALVFVRLRSPAPASPQTQSAAKRPQHLDLSNAPSVLFGDQSDRGGCPYNGERPCAIKIGWTHPGVKLARSYRVTPTNSKGSVGWWRAMRAMRANCTATIES